MSCRSVLIAWALAVVCFRATAHADLTAFWRNNPITPEAIADDPVLAGMQSWSVLVTHDNGYWVSAGARLTLPSGLTFYRNALGDDLRPSPAAIAQHPALAYHTYVTSPHHIFNPFYSPSVLGPFPESQPPTSFGGGSDPLPGTFSVSWGHPETVVYPTPVGTYEILRVTFPNQTVPVVHPQSRTWTTNPEQMAVITAIPEPALPISVVLILFGAHRRSA